MQNSDVEVTNFPKNTSMRIGDKLIDLSTPIVMGIINVTPDSFYSRSRSTNQKEILLKVEGMLQDGATIIDIGGYSSRPGAENITQKEEINRIAPVLESVRKSFPDAIFSLDTFRSEIAAFGLEAGMDIINDISGFSIDPKLPEVIAKYKVPYILMHMRGTPQTMNKNTNYDNIFKEMVFYFTEKIRTLQEKGVTDIIIDPGFGFSKTMEQNYFILNNLQHFQLLNKPILAGLSRKSMIYKKLGVTAEESLNGTIALNTLALSKGAKLLRVHDVKEAFELIKIMA